MSSVTYVKLKDCCTVVGGATPKRNVPEYWGCDVPWITPKDVSKMDTPILEDAPEYISKAGFDNCSTYMLPKGAILLTSRAPIGNVAIAGRDMCTNQGFKSLVPGKNVDSVYLYHCIKYMSPQIQALGNGATFKEVSKKVVEEFEIPLQPLEEQKRIAAILDKADAIRRKRKQAIDLTDQLLRSIFLDMFGDPVTNPKGLKVLPVGELTKCIVPGRDKPKSFTGETLWVTTKDLEHLGTTLKQKNFIGLSIDEIKEVKAKVVPQNSVLMTCVGDLGVISIAGVPMVINQQLHAFQCGDELESQFLMYALSFQKDYMLKMASSTTVPYMNKTVCNSIPVIVPPIDLQRNFVNIANKIRDSLVIKRKYNETLSTLLSSLSQRAFNGELTKQTEAA